MHAIHDSDWPLFQQLLRDYRAGKLRPQPPQPAAPAGPRSVAPVVVTLLDNLESGGTARAERMVYRDEVEGVDISAIGVPEITRRTFQITFEGEQSDEIPLSASAAEVGAALQKIPEAHDNLLAVTLGNRLEETVTICRWMLALQYRKPDPQSQARRHWSISITGAATANSDVIVRPNRYHGTGSQVEVHCALPVGDPTPLRAGAQCACLHFPGVGFGVVAAEVRKYVQPFFLPVD